MNASVFSHSRIAKLSFAILLFSALFTLYSQPALALPAGFQQFYTPLPADTARTVMVNIDNDPVLSTGMHYVVGVTASADNTTVYYDHWENGFLTGAAGDQVVTLNKGQTYKFESSNVPGSPRGTATHYDGGDRVFVAGSLLQLVVSVWPESPGTVYADAWEVYPVQAWTSNITIPIAESLAAAPTSYTDFTKVWAVVMAGTNGTSVTIADPGGPGLSTTLNQGKAVAYEVKGVGATVTASQPVQVQLMAGRPNSGSASELRGYTMMPRTFWTSSYVAPVPGWSGGKMELYLYNPNASAITVNWQERTASGSFSLGAGLTRSYSSLTGHTVPVGSGVSLQGSNVFWGVGAGDSGSATYDWGYDLIPTGFLGTDNYVSWAPGTSNLSANGSPVFVTALNNNTTVFVDYGPNDGVFDATYTLSAMQAVQIYDPDKDNSGMHIVSTGLAAVAWGESPDVAGSGAPYLDMGYTTLPLPESWIDVALRMDKTASPSSVNVGQNATFTLVTSVPATASSSATGVNVKDLLPVGWEYQVGSSTPSEPIVTGSIATGQTLTWNLNAAIGIGGNLTITFQAHPTLSADTTNPNRNVASATGVSLGATLTADDDAFVTVLLAPNVSAAKSWTLALDTGDVGPSPGDTLQYTVVIRNTGNTSAAGVTFNDTVDPNTSLICNPPPTVVPGVLTGCTPTALSASIGALAPNASATITFRVVIASSVPAGVTRVSNQGQVSGSNFPTTATDDPAVGGSQDPTVTPIFAAPRLSAAKSDTLLADLDGNGVPSPGDQLRYTVTIVNSGTTAAASVVFSDTPDSHTHLLNGSVTTSAGVVTAGNNPGDASVGVSIGALNGGGASVTITFAVVIDNPVPVGVDQVANQGVITSANYPATLTDDPDLPGNSDSTTTPITAAPAMYASKTDSLAVDADNNGVPSPGDTLLYQIVVVNNGNQAGLATLVNDFVDPNTQLVVGSVLASQGAVTSGNTAGDTSVAVEIGTLAGGGGAAQISFRVTIVDPLPADVTQVVNQATISGANFSTLVTDDPDSPGSNESTVTSVSADPILVASKTGRLLLDADNNGLVSPGDTLNYYVTIANLGNQAATNLVYDDTPDSYTLLQVGSVTTTLGAVINGNNPGDATITVNVSVLPAGSNLTIAYNAVIANPLPPGVSQFVNQGTLTSAELPSLLTDDPGASGGSDPTVMPLALGGITGVVFNDLNGDGMQDPGEDPLANVLISLYDSSGNVITTTTAPDGSYLFASLTPGSYTVVETDPAGYTSTTNNTAPANVVASVMAIADFGDQQVGAISGVVYDDVNGNGLQDAGETGLDGVTITLYDAAGNPVTTTLTLPDGSYQFAGLPPGSYTVVESDSAGYTSSTSNSVAVSLPAGGAATANFGDQHVGSVSGVAFNDLNGNGLQDPGESGLAGATITLYDAAGSVVLTATTGADGGYLFTGILPGSYTVVETDPEGYTSSTNNTVPISVAPGGSANANFGDQLVGAVSGIVFNDLNGNGLQEPGETGLNGILITLYDSSGNPAGSAITGADGSYLINGVTPGAYTVSESDPASYVSTTSNTVPVSVPAGGSASANFGDQQVGTVSGVVYNDTNGNGIQDPGESGLGGVTVELFDSSSNLIATAITAGDGTYLFTGIIPGAYNVAEITPAGFTSTTNDTAPINVQPGGSATANFGDQQVGTVSGVVYNDANGNGVQDPGEGGLGGVLITLTDGINTYTTATAGDGSYLFTGVVAGSYTVSETDPAGYTSTTGNSVPVSVAPGGSASASFGDQQVGSLSGVAFNDLNGNGLQDPGEAGIGGVTIILTDGTNVFTTTTAGDGSYLFTGVTAGVYSVAENDPAGYTSTSSNTVIVSLSPGGSASANFGDQQVGTISGNVFDDVNGDGSRQPGENGLGGVIITLTDGTNVYTATTSGDGYYLFTGVAPGPYIVQEGDPLGYTSTTNNSVPVSVPPGGAAIADFGDQQVGAVSGVVFSDFNGNGAEDPGDVGLGGVTVYLVDSQGNIVATAVTAGDGSYVFTGVTPGAYTVQAGDPPGYVSTTSNTAPISVAPGGAASANFGDQPVGTLSGVVFNDLNGNGVQDAGEAGIGGVTVTLLDDLGNPAGSATTAGDGSYLFTAVISGAYTVQESDPMGFVSTTSNSVAVSVPAGDAATANFGDQPAGVVSGTVYNDLNGNGVQDRGEPGLGGVTVTLLDEFGNPVGSVTTAGNGSYLFTDVPAGTYSVVESDPSGYTSTTANSAPIVVPPGGAATANFGDQQAGLLSGVVFSDLNGNGVQDPGEVGLGGIMITITDEFGAVITITTAGDGSYLLPFLPPGNYTVQESDPTGYGSTTPNSVAVTIPPGGAGFANFGDEAWIGMIGSQVWWDVNGNGVMDAGEVGYGGVAVELRYAGSDGLLDTPDDVLTYTVTAPDGTYLFTELPPGVYRVDPQLPPELTLTTHNDPLTLTLAVAEANLTADFGVKSNPTAVSLRAWGVEGSRPAAGWALLALAGAQALWLARRSRNKTGRAGG